MRSERLFANHRLRRLVFSLFRRRMRDAADRRASTPGIRSRPPIGGSSQRQSFSFSAVIPVPQRPFDASGKSNSAAGTPRPSLLASRCAASRSRTDATEANRKKENGPARGSTSPARCRLRNWSKSRPATPFCQSVKLASIYEDNALPQCENSAASSRTRTD
jgi:hypothetical protein